MDSWPMAAAVEELDAAFRGKPNLTVSGLEDATYGPYDVPQLEAIAEAYTVLPGAYRMPQDGQVRVAFFTIGDITVLAYLDAFADVETAESVRTKTAELAAILDTIRFDAG